MIYLVTGEDTYRRRQALGDISKASGLEPEKLDGTELNENQLADSIAGSTLFSTRRLVVITDISTNKPLWDTLAAWVGRVSDSTTLVIVEPKPDKRTKAYKTISKVAKVITAESWTDRQANDARRWARARAAELSVPISPKQVDVLVERATSLGERPGAYIIDQQQLENALQSLSILDKVTDENIAAVLPESNASNVFELLQTAMSGSTGQAQKLLNDLHATADPYQTFGLLTVQWTQLVALKITTESPESLGAQIGASPYVLKKLQPYAASLSQARVKALTELLASLDVRLKTTSADPWTIVDRFVGELGTK